MIQRAATGLFALVLFGCGGSAPPETGTMQETSPPAASTAVSALRTAAEPGNAAEFKITFKGIVLHVFEPEAYERALILQDEAFRHYAALELPGNVKRDDLTEATGQSCPPGVPRCRIALSGIAIRIVDAAGEAPQPAPVVRSAAFNEQVPKLKEVTLASGLIEEAMVDVRERAVPAAPISAVFLLNGGTLSSVPFEHCSRFDPDHDNDGRIARRFSKEVTLTGSISGGAVLQFKTESTGHEWKTIRFDGGATLDLEFDNGPMQDEHSPRHFSVNRGVLRFAEDVAYPLVRDCTRDCPDLARCGTAPPPPRPGELFPHGTVAGCTNNQWP